MQNKALHYGLSAVCVGVGEQLFPLKAALGHKRVQQTNNHAAFLRTDLLSICAANIC